MTQLDRRRIAARPDLAAESLRGVVTAARFVPGVTRRVIATATPLRPEPDPSTGIDTEAIYGETVLVYEEREGWAWVQLAGDGYVGWLSSNDLAPPLTPTHRVGALRTFIYPTPSIKKPPLMALTFGSTVAVRGAEGSFLALVEGGFVFAPHLTPLDTLENDPVAVAERFLGVPYLWGGKTSLGLDCSGLVQTAMQACGISCPRDSDMQAGELGVIVDAGPDWRDVRRGDLLFWKGHVAFVEDRLHILHASGAPMSVVREDLGAALARIAAEAGDPIVCRALTPR